jgi:AsmA protein
MGELAMRVIKVLGLTMASAIVLLMLLLAGIWLFVDPNDYKDRIAAAVRESTGRTLSLPGKLKLSVFPWVAVETGAASLGNPAGFGDAPFLTLQRAQLRVKLLPLLKKQFEVGRIEIDGLDLALKQNAAGKGNWEEWGAGSTPEAGESASMKSMHVSLAGIRIRDSRIAFENMVAQGVNVQMGRVATGVAIPVDIKLQLLTAPRGEPLPLTALFKLTVDLDQQRYQLADLQLQGVVQPQGAPKALSWKFATPRADIDLAAQTLTPAEFTAQIGSAAVSGNITGEKLVDAPALSGRFALQALAPKPLLQEFGITPPVTRDATRLQHFSAQGDFAWGNKVARASNLTLLLDDSKLAGRFGYDTVSRGMDFALTLDTIDLDAYQPPPTAPGESSDPIELPVDFLKPMRAKGTFNVGEIRIGGANLSALTAGINVANGVASFFPLKARFYGGQYSGHIGLDMRASVPQLTMDEHMTGIDIAALMKDYADTKKLSGRGNLNVKLAASGRSGDALLRTLNGRLDTNLEDGAVEGIDIWYAIAQAQSLIQKRQLASAQNSRRTVFETFKASADVVNGVATTQDLTIDSQLLRITGQGSTNLVTQALDYRVTATVLKAPPGADAGIAQLERASIPVKITGTFADPKVRPDLAGMARARVKQEVEQRKEEVQEKVKDKVKDKLKNLFGR